jgi:hypothetical protein
MYNKFISNIMSNLITWLRFRIFTMAKMSLFVFESFTSYGLVDRHQYFGRIYHTDLQTRRQISQCLKCAEVEQPMTIRILDQEVSRLPFFAEARFCVRIIPCGICSRQIRTGTVFYPRSSVLPCQYHSSVSVNIHILSGG